MLIVDVKGVGCRPVCWCYCL